MIYLISSIKILAEYERGVIFRLGRVLGAPKGPGVILVFAPIDRMVRISLRVEAMEVPPQDVVTRDNVTVKVNAVVYFNVVSSHQGRRGSDEFSLRDLAGFADHAAQRAGRSGTGRTAEPAREAECPAASRARPAHRTLGHQGHLVEVKQVDLPEQMIRAIARQAEAERERRAKIIHADGEYEARKTGHGGRSDSTAAGRHSVALSADAGGDWLGKEHDGCVSPAYRYILVFGPCAR